LSPEQKRAAKIVLVAMTLANAMILVDQTAVPLALPSIMESFDSGSKQVQWVLTCSLLPLAALLVFTGRLGDLIGLRKVFLTGAVVFITGSVLAGISPSLEILLACRVLQGVGGALMLPLSVAIVNSTFPAEERGKALGTMGGMAAVAAALGPTIGGLLTSFIDWRAVMLINVPLAIATVLLTLRYVPDIEPAHNDREKVDIPGTVLLSIVLAGIVFGLSQSQVWGWDSPGVYGPLIAAVLAAAVFFVHERRARSPLVDFSLLRRRNYLGASLSQLLSGMAEIGLGVIFPLLLILNLEMTPAEAGIALIPTTVPMIIVAPLAGSWYDRVGGRVPLITGYLLLAASAVLLAIAANTDKYLELLPGLLLYGIGLSLVLTTNDPVSLDEIDADDEGQASGVSATAEQFGGALGIAILYSIFHGAYVSHLNSTVSSDPNIPDFAPGTENRLRDAIEAAEATGLHPDSFDPDLQKYLQATETASNLGYEITFIVVAAIALAAAAVTGWLVRKPPEDPNADPNAPATNNRAVSLPSR